MAAVPADLKLIVPYIQRGQEIASVDPVVSYFCKYYAAQLAIANGSNSPESQTYLATLLDQLEGEKEKLKDHEFMKDDSTASQHCTNFALKIFAKADTEERQGKATKVTARNFIVSSQFLQVISAFGTLPSDIAEKIKYAKWKAAEILKAIREGRTPVPSADAAPAPVSDPAQPPASAPSLPQMEMAESKSPSDVGGNGSGSSPNPVAAPGAATFVPVPASNLPPPRGPAPALVPAPVASGQTPADIDLMLDPADAKNAQKHARWAISALEYDDVAAAVENLQKAIQILRPYHNK
ncbi:hypothetical protein GGI12_001942 [Dipsacomyces acuminosporus]|nr:hypothetical protein GGI12_001942 [Dipsacomyces acuminosporus]